MNRKRFLKPGRRVLLVIAMLVATGCTWMWVRPHLNAMHHDTRPAAPLVEVKSVARIERIDQDAVVVPHALADKMGLQVQPAKVVDEPYVLPGINGVVALDNDCLSRVHSRFAGEVVEIAALNSSTAASTAASTATSSRPLRVGDWVNQGDLLAVVWSTDLGVKKSELVQSFHMLRSETAARDRLKLLFSEGASAGKSYREADVAVQTRLAEIASTERTLRTWRLNDSDIAAIRAEAELLASSQAPAGQTKDWARVEVRAPMSGAILEKNVTMGDIVDTSTDMFKICDTSHLMVWAHVYEEDVPLVQSLPRPTPWKIKVPTATGGSVEYNGMLDRISSVIDAAQHTALVGGCVENKSGELKVGQFVTVSIDLPPRSDELELPATALFEDGRQSVVFVQDASNENSFTRKIVQVVRRTRDRIYIKSNSGSLLPGTPVVMNGVMTIENAMDQQTVSPKHTNVAGVRPNADTSHAGVSTIY